MEILTKQPTVQFFGGHSLYANSRKHEAPTDTFENEATVFPHPILHILKKHNKIFFKICNKCSTNNFVFYPCSVSSPMP